MGWAERKNPNSMRNASPDRADEYQKKNAERTQKAFTSAMEPKRRVFPRVGLAIMRGLVEAHNAIRGKKRMGAADAPATKKDVQLKANPRKVGAP